MSDEEVTVRVDNTEAEIAAMDAERAAMDANMAASAAMGATIAQGQLIGQVMEHAREDARESAADAEEAASEAETAAETAIAVNSITAEMYADMERRLALLESKNAERESAPPTDGEAITTIPSEGEPAASGEETEEEMATSQSAAVPKAKRKGHLKRGRRR